MDKIFYYLREMLVVAVPAAIVFSCFWPYRKRALQAMGLRTTFWREIGLIAFIMCLFGVLAVTLWPVYWMEDSPGLWGDIELLVDRPSLWVNVNLVPFRMFRDYWEDLTRGGGFFTILNFLGNLAVFVPLGFFPALLFRNANWRRSALVGLGTSVLVEVGHQAVRWRPRWTPLCAWQRLCCWARCRILIWNYQPPVRKKITRNLQGKMQTPFFSIW